MDEQRRLRVVRLAQAESHARQRFEALGMANISHLNAQERVDLDTEYALATADWRDALDALHDEVGVNPRWQGCRVVVDPNMPADAWKLIA